MQKLVASTLLAICLALISICQACSQEIVFPQANWDVRTPEEMHLDPHRLEAVARALGGRGCVVKQGFVVKTWGDQAQLSDWFSSAKPVLSTLLMFAIQEGKVAGPDVRLVDLGWPLIEKDQPMTLRHLGTMTSGYARPEPPGVAWAYNDFAIQLYQKTLFDRIFKEDPIACAHAPQRFGALALQDGLKFREKNRRLSASVRDFARIAWLWNNYGRWGDRQVIDRALFDEFCRPQVPADLPLTAKAATNDYLQIGSYGGDSDHFTKAGPGVYGFNWWFNAKGGQHPDALTWPDAPPDAFMSLGFKGNCALMIPSLDLVVACAEGAWGELTPGDSDCVMNQRLRLIAHAGTPTADEHLAPGASALNKTRPSDNAFTITGKLAKWSPLALTVRGPEASEAGNPNPNLDIRFNVTFRQGERQVVVPGYFAADGDAAETGADAGNCWRTHFMPDAEGTWTWSVSLRSGAEVAVSDDPSAGDPVAGDGLSGSFQVGPVSLSDGPFASKGRLRYVGERYLRFAETGEIYLKHGVDSPENLLAFADFDDTTPTHRYGPHELDFRSGDPVWRGGRGRNLMGALNYLASKGVNSIYFLPMNVRGDGKDVWPWIADDERTRYDTSKLAQWEIVFAHMDRLGIALHVVTQEQENDQLLDRGELGTARKLYYRELIARFAHHGGVVWNLGEENTNTDPQRRAHAAYLQRLDPYKNLVVVHTFPKQQDKVYEPLLGFADLQGVSLQTNDTREQTLRWVKRSSEADHPWVVCLDEIGPADTGVVPDAVDYRHDDVRREHLWPHLLSGGAGVEWLFGYKYAHHDINLEDFRSRDHLWDLTRYAVEFLRPLPLAEMRSADELTASAGALCLAKPGEVYALYLPNGGATELELPAGEYRVRWFNPRRGGKLQRGEIETLRGPGKLSLGQPPKEPEQDWACLLERANAE